MINRKFTTRDSGFNNQMNFNQAQKKSKFDFDMLNERHNMHVTDF